MGCVGLFVRGCGTLRKEKDECGRTERQPALS
jgi:hypothetical protein